MAEIPAVEVTKESLRLLYVGVLPPHTGGAALISSQILVGTASKGNVVRALAPLPESEFENEDLYALSHPQIEVTRYPVPFHGVNPMIPLPEEYRRHEHNEIARRLPALLIEDRPDLIIVGRESFVWQVPALAEDHSIPSVLVCHGGTLVGIQKGTHPETLVEQFFEELQRVSCIVTVGHHLTGFLESRGFGQVKTIQNGVDLASFSKADRKTERLTTMNVSSEEILVLFPGLLKSQKRPLDLVAAARLSLDVYPKLVFFIVGDGPLRGEMESACREAGIIDRFHFLGWVPRELMPEYYNLADLVVLPSEAEGLSLAAIEAMACGKPLIASDIPPFRELIKDRENGILHTLGDPEDLASKLVRLAQAEPLRREIASKAFQSSANRSIDRVIDQYVSTFEEVVHDWRYGRSELIS